MSANQAQSREMMSWQALINAKSQQRQHEHEKVLQQMSIDGQYQGQAPGFWDQLLSGPLPRPDLPYLQPGARPSSIGRHLENEWRR